MNNDKLTARNNIQFGVLSLWALLNSWSECLSSYYGYWTLNRHPWKRSVIKSRAIPLLPLWAFIARYRVKFTFTYTLLIKLLYLRLLPFQVISIGSYRRLHKTFQRLEIFPTGKSLSSSHTCRKYLKVLMAVLFSCTGNIRFTFFSFFFLPSMMP